MIVLLEIVSVILLLLITRKISRYVEIKRKLSRDHDITRIKKIIMHGRLELLYFNKSKKTKPK